MTLGRRRHELAGCLGWVFSEEKRESRDRVKGELGTTDQPM